MIAPKHGMTATLIIAFFGAGIGPQAVADGHAADGHSPSVLVAALEVPKLKKPKIPKAPKIPDILPDKDDIPTREDINNALTMTDEECGDDEQPVCPISVQLKPCDKGLVADDGVCYVCGGAADRACPVTVRIPSCDGGLMEVSGRCQECGADGERACPITVQMPSCDQGLLEHDGHCEACGAHDQRKCPVTVQIPACDEGLDDWDGRCWTAGPADDPMLHGGPSVVSLVSDLGTIQVWDRGADGEIYRRKRVSKLFGGYRWKRWRDAGTRMRTAWHPAAARTGEVTVVAASRGGKGSPITYKSTKEVFWNNGHGDTHAAPGLCTNGVNEFYMVTLDSKGRYQRQMVARNVSDVIEDWSVIDFEQNADWVSAPGYACQNFLGWRFEVIAGLKKRSGGGRDLFVRALNSVSLPDASQEACSGGSCRDDGGNPFDGTDFGMTHIGVPEEPVPPPHGRTYKTPPAIAIHGKYVAMAVLASDGRVWFTKRAYDQDASPPVWTGEWAPWSLVAGDRTFRWMPGITLSDETLLVVAKQDDSELWWTSSEDGGGAWVDWESLGTAGD